ncbi:uncharacterized protein LMH87_008364 [Akanthomyces muscarius]|uniref:Uncharacterized protein n=1 Tax=Akanthomyces muscarius TaxID=2231603 RepID=A0A9W8UQT8_AKAMU|nr:uncharacterized protein LMH87_008364 [Akanthomyces muscarius]KAJ4159464.1 hypothetical protein LMH87_008364 [Akanthomyces muscarius]
MNSETDTRGSGPALEAYSHGGWSSAAEAVAKLPPEYPHRTTRLVRDAGKRAGADGSADPAECCMAGELVDEGSPEK